MRPQTACVACRNRRRKCDIADIGQACIWCRDRNLHCSLSVSEEYANDNISFEDVVSLSSMTHGTESLARYSNIDEVELPPYSLCLELVGIYFKYIHDTFHSLFHQPSLMEDVGTGDGLSRAVMLGIISLSARFSEDPYFATTEPRIRGRPYARAAEKLLNLHEASVTTIQTCVLLGAHAITEGDPVTEALYYGVACRLAMLLDLPNMVPVTRIERETNIRIWWTLNMVDVWTSNGLQTTRALQPKNGVPLPMEETSFLLMSRFDSIDQIQDGPLMTQQASSQGMLAQFVKLNAILFEVAQLIKAVSKQGIHVHETSATFSRLSHELSQWYDELSPNLKDTPENMIYYAELGLGGVFVAIYLGYYYFTQLLYYQFLYDDNSEQANPQARLYADRCKAHSTSLCEIVYRAYATPGAEVYYTMVGHVLTIASTVQLHILLFSSDEVEIVAARQRLEQNFIIITRLQELWPVLDISRTRFEEFHKLCREKCDTSCFRLDEWMLRFLLDFAKPISADEPRMLY